MNLADEDIGENVKTKKVVKIIIGILVVLIVLILLLIFLLLEKNKDELKIIVDGKSMNTLSQSMIIDRETGKIKIAIKDMASALGYNVYDGEYNKASQDDTKCYVQYMLPSTNSEKSTTEISGFKLDSNKIYKVQNEQEQYQYFTIADRVERIDGKLYTSIEGIQVALNLTFTYDTATNTITILTLPTYITSVTNSIATNANIKLNDNFQNQKALLKNMMVIEDVTQKKYGVMTFDNKIILDAKYDSIEYVEGEEWFIVTNNSKIGIIDNSKKTRIDLIYDELTRIDSKLNLYLVKKDGYYGIIDENGSIVVHLEYDEIGINVKSSDVENNYLLLNKYVPVKKDGKYGVYDLNGNLVIPIQYNSLGCVSRNNNTSIIIPDYNLLVVQRDGKYGLTNFSGKEVIPCVLDSIYWEVQNGENVYKMVQSERVIDVIEYLNTYAPEEKANATVSE